VRRLSGKLTLILAGTAAFLRLNNKLYHAGQHLAELQFSETEAASERALAFAREESDQALALICAQLVAMKSAVATCTELLMSALADTGSNNSPDRSLEAVPSQALSYAGQENEQTGSERDASLIDDAETSTSDEEARKLRQCTETAAECIRRVCPEAAALRQERDQLESQLSSALCDLEHAMRRMDVLEDVVAAATSAADEAVQRAEHAESANMEVQQLRDSLQQELQDLRGNASALETSQVQLQARLSMLQEEESSLKHALQALEQGHAELQNQMWNANVERESLLADVQAVNVAKEAVQSELAQTVASLDVERLLRAQAQEELMAACEAGADLERQLGAANKGAAKVPDYQLISDHAAITLNTFHCRWDMCCRTATFSAKWLSRSAHFAGQQSQLILEVLVQLQTTWAAAYNRIPQSKHSCNRRQ